MRCDDEVGVLAAGDRDGQGRWKATRRAQSVDDLANGAEVEGVVLEGFDESFLEIDGTGGVEELEQSCGGAADVAALLGDGAEKCLTARCGLGEAIEPAVLAGTSLVLDEPSEMGGLLYLLSPIPRASVRREHQTAIGDPHSVEVREHNERPASAVEGNGVVVEIEAGIGCLSDLDFDALEGGEWIVGKRKQDAALVVEGLTDRARTVFNPGAIERGGGGPIDGLAIEVGEIGERASLEEGLADVANGPLDAPLLVAAGDGDRPGLEAIV
jgi:hypothetical protein